MYSTIKMTKKEQNGHEQKGDISKLGFPFSGKEWNSPQNHLAQAEPEYGTQEFVGPEGWVSRPENVIIKRKTTTTTTTTNIITTPPPPPTSQAPTTVILSTSRPTTPPATTAPPAQTTQEHTTLAATTVVPITLSPTTPPATTQPLTTPALTTPGPTTSAPTTPVPTTTPCPPCERPLYSCGCPNVLNTTVTLNDVCANYNTSGTTLLDKSCDRSGCFDTEQTNLNWHVNKDALIKQESLLRDDNVYTFVPDICDVFGAYTEPPPTINR